MPVPKQLFLEILRRVPLFNELSEDELGSIAAEVSVSRYEAGQILYSEGEKGGDLLVVMEGSVRVVRMSASGRHRLLAIERQGSSLGEVSVFDGGPYSATAIAITQTGILRLRGQQFRALCVAQPAVAIKVIGVLAIRLGTVRELISRNPGRLHGEGLIVMRRRSVLIPDEDALRAQLLR